jgi:alkylhydroperoxidase family enzyme
MPRNSKQPRIQPLEPPYDAGAAAAVELLGPPIALFRTWARRPELARGIAGWGGYYLSRRSALTLRQRELVIDRTTALCGADYEWGVHIAVFAGRAGLTAEQVRSLGAGQPDDPCWADPADRAVLRAVDELHARHDLSDGAWDGLIDAAGPDGALDLLLLCGWYHAISFTVRSLRLPLEPGTAPIPSG